MAPEGGPAPSRSGGAGSVRAGLLRLTVLALALLASAFGCASATAAPAVPADTFRDAVGVNTHVMHGDSPYWNLPELSSALAYLGVRHVRDGMRWYRTRATQWFVEEQARRFRSLADDGVRFDLLLPGPREGYGTVREALDAMAATGGTESVEVANEWDLNGDPVAWTGQLHGHLREARKELDAHLALRGTPLVGPGFGRPGSSERFGDESALVDLGNAHPYTAGLPPEVGESPVQRSLAGNIDALRIVSGDRPFVFTESGYHDALNAASGQAPVDRATAAVYTVRTLLEHVRAGATRTYLYELADSFADPAMGNPEAHFGLFDFTWQPKPAATAVRNLLAVLKDPAPAPRGAALDYAIDGPAGDLRELLLSRAGGGFTVALWRTAPVWDVSAQRRLTPPATTVTIRLPRPFTTASVFRPVSSTDPVETRSDVSSVSVAVGAEPVLVDLEPAAGPPPAPAPGGSRPWWCSWFPWAC